MEGDLIDTITANTGVIGHFHTGGVPGRHEIDATQEIQYAAVMKAIASANFSGYVAHEFLPTGDALTSLRQAIQICDV
jgi:hydroxypyruvate isomerase